MRAGIACLLGAEQAPELLLLDEPSSDLDLPRQDALASALAAYRGALVLVNHDPAFVRDVGVQREVRLPPVAGETATPAGAAPRAGA